MYLGAFTRLLPISPRIFKFCRNYNVLEYQSKVLMNEYDLAVQDFRIASSVEEAERVVASFHPKLYVLKAQVHAGGRGLGRFAFGGGSGIQFTDDPKQVPVIVSKMIGNRLITNQTSDSGVIVNTVMIADAVEVKKERYLAILLDRTACCPVVITSVDGGVSIEEVAHKNPDLIKKEFIDVREGMTDIKARNISCSLGFTPGSAQHTFMCSQLMNLYNLFVDLDCLQVEINPLGEKVDGSLINMDAKFAFDSNAMFRQRRVAALIGIEELGKDSNSLIANAKGRDFNYISLPDGNIGCMVNGAGLAMATMDILSLHNGKAANFLDLGGKASQDDVEVALQMLNSDDRLKCILINIFGGIVNCLMVAEGLVVACHRHKPQVPLVVRLEGTSAKEGRQVLKTSNLNIQTAEDMEEAAIMACRLTQ